ncbi:eukaryotic translation initiation factor 4G [Wolffia australiana]
MSLNQSRAEKSEAHLRKGGRSGSSANQRGFSAGSGRGGGAAPPSSSSSSSSSHAISSDNPNQQPGLPTRSVKKSGGGHGGHSRANPSVLSSESSAQASVSASSGHGQTRGSSHGAPPVHANNATKAADSAAQSGGRGHSRPPHPQSFSGDSDSSSPMNLPKGDPSKGFQLQFGTISPGFVNGMQIPPRTSSAPPNFDEQKRDQMPAVSVPSLPKIQPQPKKEVISNHAVSVKSQPLPQAKRDIAVHAPVSSSLGPSKTSVAPVHGISVPVGYQQQQIPIQFGGPNPQIPSQGVGGGSLPVSLSLGSTQNVQQQIFVPSFPYPQGIHQGLGFPQLTSQMGNMRVGLTQPFTPQQDSNFVGARKNPVKITHPETHEELRLDRRTDSYVDQSPRMQQPNVSPYGNYYQTMPPGSYNPAGFYMQTPSSVALTGAQMTGGAQAARYNYVGQTGPNASFLNQHVINHVPVTISRANQPLSSVESVNLEASSENAALSVPLPTASVQVTVRAPTMQRKPQEKEEKPNLQKRSGESAPHQTGRTADVSEASHATPIVDIKVPEKTSQELPKVSVDLLQKAQISITDAPKLDGRKRDSFKRHDSFKDQKKTNKKEAHQSQQQQQINAPDTAVIQPHKIPMEDVNSSEKPSVDVCLEEKTNEVSTATAENPTKFSGGDAPLVSQTKEILVSQSSLVESQVLEDPIIPDAPEEGANNTQKIQENFDTDVELSTPIPRGGNGIVNHHQEPEDKDEHVPVSLASDEVKKVAGQSTESPIETFRSAEQARDIVSGDNAADNDSKAMAASSSEPISVEEIQTDNEDVKTNGGSEINIEVDNLAGALSESCRVDDQDNQVSIPKSDVIEEMPSSESSDAESRLPVDSASEKLSRESSSTELILADSETVSGPGKVGDVSSSGPSAGKKEKQTTVEQPRPRPTSAKKKKKVVLSRADAAGTNLDLYMAYKAPEEKKEVDAEPAPVETATSLHAKDEVASAESKRDDQIKAEPDDWEDAVDISSPKLNAADAKKALDEGSGRGGGGGGRKYSRDFLLTFRDLWLDLPSGFEIGADISAAIVASPGGSPFPSPGRIIDRPSSVSIRDRRPSGNQDDDKWTRGSGLQVDVGNFRPGQAGHGVLRHPRGPINAYPGGILSAPMPPVPSPGPRANADADRWQRGAGMQRGLIPSPQAPSVTMHRAENRYEVGKVSDEEQAKQRQLKGILNKLTPQNFERLLQQAKDVNIDNATTLSGVISQIFDKALMEPTFCEMYANFCFHLASALPDFSEDNEKITFKRLLLNKCQEEFERGEREQNEASLNVEGESKESAAQREEKRVNARRRMLGNIRLIGELYKKKMLTERIMHECIKKLLGQYQNPDEEDIEALCNLMSTIGEMIDHHKAKDHMDAYFEMMAKLSTNMNLSSRVRFMLKDSIDLRKNKWQQRRKVEGPKKIDEVHRDAAQERQGQAGRMSRGPGMGPGGRRGGPSPPVDYGPRGSNPSLLSSSGAQPAGMRGYPPQRGSFSATQDVRMEERHAYEARTLSVPLPQRQAGGDSITLGPQGGLARGMSNRGQTMGSGAEEASSRRPGSSSSNGYGGGSLSRDQGPVVSGRGPAASERFSVGNENTSESRQLSEEDLREKSILAIREYYSARDENEVALCIQELGSPSAYPTVLSLWITDSFERKEGDRRSLSHLLVQLSKPQHNLISASQLSEGFRAVLVNLEETVTDAPKAGEFFGMMMAKVAMEGVVSLAELGRLIEQAGEEPGQLVESGLAADVLGTALETMRADKGEAYVKEACAGVRLESFKGPGSARRLQAFLHL